MRKFKPNHVYHIKFLDHCIGIEDALTISFTGTFLKETKNCYIFSHWIVESDDREIVESNYEINSILKAVIVSAKELKV